MKSVCQGTWTKAQGITDDSTAVVYHPDGFGGDVSSNLIFSSNGTVIYDENEGCGIK